MNFLKRNILTISLMLLVSMCVIAPDAFAATVFDTANNCLLYTSPSPRDA